MEWYVIYIVLMMVYPCFVSSAMYVTSLREIRNCPTPKPPYEEPRSLLTQIEQYAYHDRQLIRGNISVDEEVYFNNASYQSYSEYHGQLQLRFELTEINCRNLIMMVMLKMANVVYNKRTCKLTKGFYRFKGFDIDKTDHLIPAWHWEGDMMAKIAAYHNNYSLYCIEAMITSSKINNKKDHK